MEITQLSLTGKKPASFQGDLLVYCLEQDKNEKVKIGSTLATKELKRAVKLGDFKSTLRIEKGKKFLLVGYCLWDWENLKIASQVNSVRDFVRLAGLLP